MALATFDPALPTTRDHLRLLIGDVDPTTAQFDDDTLDALLTRHADRVFCAAVEAGETLAARWTTATQGVVEKQVGRLRLKRGGVGTTLQQDYLTYIQTLKTRCADARLGTTPFFKVL